MRITYTCDGTSFVDTPSPDVVRLRIPEQIDMLCAFWGEIMPPEDRQAFTGHVASGRQEDYGIVLNGALIARACIMNLAPGRSEIGAVKVLEDFRGKGYAGQLVSHCTRLLLSRGQKALGITDMENIPMRRVFERLGFRGTRQND